MSENHGRDSLKKCESHLIMCCQTENYSPLRFYAYLWVILSINDMVIDGTLVFEMIDYFVESNFSVKMQMVHDAGLTPSSCFLWIH